MITGILGVQDDSLLNSLHDIKIYIEDIDANDGLNLNELFKYLKLKIPVTIYVNWDNFKTIDMFGFTDFDKYFDDIWYPVADDIELFDDSLDWFISIEHDGFIGFINLNNYKS